MKGELRQVIRQKITDALATGVPAHTRRDVHVPGLKGKVMAVIGMRRSGKTTFLWQCLAERLKAGWPITYEGDPGTIMGLPMRLLGRKLAEWTRAEFE